MDWLVLIEMYIVPLLATIITFLIWKFLKITVDKEKIKRLLYAIIDIITQVEKTAPERFSGLDKKAEVIKQVKEKLPKKQVGFLEKVYGGLSGAVEAAFQVSHLAGKIKKIF